METIQPSANSYDQGSKKALLQKLMSNLLNKPGRSMHEIINGVKEAISAYKNYAKEWDALNGIVSGAATGAAVGATAGGAKKDSIQNVMDQIRQQKGAQPQPQAIPRDVMQKVDPIPQPQMTPLPKISSANEPIGVPSPTPAKPGLDELVAGQSQQSNFNRPAPINNLGIRGF